MHLPKITDEPRHQPDCCLSISTKLLDIITNTFNSSVGVSENGLVLSIGSGSGLLEALLLSRWSSSSPSTITTTTTTLNTNLQIEGVEIRSEPPVNRYLPDPTNFMIVKGSWDIVSSRAHRAVSGMMFVYPRSPALVERYVRDFSSAVPAVTSTVAGREHSGEGVHEGEGRGTSPLRAVVWLGHRSDWPDFKPCFIGVPGFNDVEAVGGEDAGLVEYEMMAIIRRKIN